ncbi:MAG: DUF1697 domain-containing protein [Microscillaceae bacterium]|nr:DUF1697 domain-containing protein [Microscillaceae bacterium]
MIAFLRGINIGSHYKVPMALLKEEMIKLGFSKVHTFLNTGNIVFASEQARSDTLNTLLETHLQKVFGFSIPVMLRTEEEITALVQANPFREVLMHPALRCYVSFLKYEVPTEAATSWQSPDQSFRVLSIREKAIFSVLDLRLSQTPKGMDALEKRFGKDITTRNWNTLLKIDAWNKKNARETGQ